MTYAIVLIALIGIIFGALILIRKNKEGLIEPNAKFDKKEMLTKAEQVAYWKIVEAAGQNKIVFSQVSFSSFLKTSGEYDEKRRLFNTARQKVADFVICNKNFDVELIIEIDDKSHNTEKDAKRDAMTRSAGINTLRIKARALPDADELKSLIERSTK